MNSTNGLTLRFGAALALVSAPGVALAAPSACVPGGLTETGTGSAPAPLARSIANAPTSAAIRAIAGDWTVLRPENVRETGISLAAGTDARAALRTVGQAANACVTLQRDLRTIIVHAVGGTSYAATHGTTVVPVAVASGAPNLADLDAIGAADPAPAAQPARTSTPTPTPTPARPAVAAQAPTAPVAKLDPALFEEIAVVDAEYRLNKGETIREALTRWATSSGWTLVWRVDGAQADIRIDAAASIPRGTSFQQAVKQVMATLWRTRRPLAATAYLGNRAMVIEGAGKP